jgi:DNA topoisomerase-1
MNTLVIVESPSKIKSVGKYLGKGYTVMASVGHIRDLPKQNKNAIDIEHGFKPLYEISPTKTKVVHDIVATAKKSDKVLLATDHDREGEAIAWHVAEIIESGTKGKTPKMERITFNEITESAIQESLKHPRQVDQNLRRAQEARRVLDRLMGYDLSGLIWKKVRYGLSAGRVQSPALRILMEREREIRSFIPEWYGLLHADTTHKNTSIKLSCTTEFADKDLWQQVYNLGEKHTWIISAVKVSESKRSPYPPFTTSTLQQAASTRLGFSPRRTMQAAQKLYESGHISYMRTDSTNLSKQSQSDILSYITKHMGANLAHPRTYVSKSKNAQEAHEAIRPTHAHTTRAGNTHDEESLYHLIWVRSITSQMPDALLEKTSIQSLLPHKGIDYTFSLNGQRVLSPGWLAVDTAARSDDVELPIVAVGDKLTLVKMDSEEKYTTPQNRYSEAGLIKELEKRGIGRPSTYASTIETLVERNYVERSGRTLTPTDTGDVVSSFLEEHFADYISDSFTAQMETELDEIAEGTKEYPIVLGHWYWPLHNEVEKKDIELAKATNLGDAEAHHICPDCGKPMHIKLGKSGKFLSCSNYPECTGALAIDGTAIREQTPIGVDPESGLPIYVLTGKFGPYVQLGSVVEREEKTTLKNGKEKIKLVKENPKRASLPAKMKPEDVTLEIAVHLLTLPRTLGMDPISGVSIIANIGRFGPYIGRDREFRSLKGADDPYTITLERALELINTPKQLPRGVSAMREVGIHPKTKKVVTIFQDKKGVFKRAGLRKIYLDTTKVFEDIALEDVI